MINKSGRQSYQALNVSGLVFDLTSTKLSTHPLAFLRNHTIFSTLSDDDDAVTLDLSSLNNGFVDSVVTFKLEVHLGNETDINIPGGKRASHSDVSTVATHELDDSHPIFSCLGFHIGRIDELYCSLASCVETKRSINERDIIINSLGDSTDGYLNIFLSQLFLKS